MVTEAQHHLDRALQIAALYSVPPEFVLHRDVLCNWHRRTKRLERALICSLREPVAKDRAIAINRALRRLHTGRLTS